ncbi:hypothetical protein ACFQU2_15410 [Siccirubricoccus deserti]
MLRYSALAALPLLPFTAWAQPAPVITLPETVVQAQRAAAARQGILARFGAREVTIDRQTIEALPGGADQPLNQILLQTPAWCRTASATSMSAASTATCNTG